VQPYSIVPFLIPQTFEMMIDDDVHNVTFPFTNSLNANRGEDFPGQIQWFQTFLVWPGEVKQTPEGTRKRR
jgi:hypothetical protein